MNRNPAPWCAPQVRAQHVEQRDEHRQLGDQRQTRAKRVDLILLVELHQLLLLTLLVVLVLGLQRFQLRLQALEGLHRAELLQRQRHEQRADDHRQEHDREAPAGAQVVVEDLEHRLEHVDERLEYVRGDEHHQAPLGWSSWPEQALMLWRVEPAVTPGIAAKQPPAREDQAPEYAELSDCLRGVLRTRGEVLAARSYGG
jgi:hypothetical protein